MMVFMIIWEIMHCTESTAAQQWCIKQ